MRLHPLLETLEITYRPVLSNQIVDETLFKRFLERQSILKKLRPDLLFPCKEVIDILKSLGAKNQLQELSVKSADISNSKSEIDSITTFLFEAFPNLHSFSLRALGLTKINKDNTFTDTKPFNEAAF